MTIKLTDADFIAAWDQHGNAREIAKHYGMSERQINKRRNSLREQGHDLRTRPALGYESRVPEKYATTPIYAGWTFPLNRQTVIGDGVVVVSSDHHYWPDQVPLAHRALLNVIKAVKPRLKILNGDVFDGGSISRHPPFGWAERPTPVQELHACQERVAEIEQALPRGCERVWCVGNHDIRFERTLVSKVPEFATLHGLRLADHFNGWDIVHSLWINREAANPTMVFHNYANGVHAGYNNAMKSGVTVVSGHTHTLECKPFMDLRGRRYGVQTGTIADLESPQFEYQGNRPSQACSGFAVLTYRDGELLQPELCQVVGNKAYFRGEVVAA